MTARQTTKRLQPVKASGARIGRGPRHRMPRSYLLSDPGDLVNLLDRCVTIKPLGPTAFRFDKVRNEVPRKQQPTACPKWAELNSAFLARQPSFAGKSAVSRQKVLVPARTTEISGPSRILSGPGTGSHRVNAMQQRSSGFRMAGRAAPLAAAQVKFARDAGTKRHVSGSVEVHRRRIASPGRAAGHQAARHRQRGVP